MILTRVKVVLDLFASIAAMSPILSGSGGRQRTVILYPAYFLTDKPTAHRTTPPLQFGAGIVFAQKQTQFGRIPPLLARNCSDDLPDLPLKAHHMVHCNLLSAVRIAGTCGLKHQELIVKNVLEARNKNREAFHEDVQNPQ